MAKIQDLIRGHRHKISLLLIFLVVLMMISCVPNLIGSTNNKGKAKNNPYTAADLGELVRPSIAYIEARKTTEPGYFNMGSGFAISADGLIITNYHVMKGSDTVMIEIDGRSFNDANVLAFSKEKDLAILKIEASNLKPLTLANTAQDVSQGEKVVAIGRPGGHEQTISEGIVSRTDRNVVASGYDHIEATTFMQKGNSGGPLINMQGEVIGVNTFAAKYDQNLSIAVTVDLIHTLLDEIGPARSIGEVFSEADIRPKKQYEHEIGELAVVLSWEGNADLDLEIWSNEFYYLGTAYELGDSPDIIEGVEGEEWFVFKDQPFSLTEERLDFTKGSYLVSVNYFGPEPENDIDTINAEILFYFPDGSYEILHADKLKHSSPYDYWFALVVDVDKQDYIILDCYYDSLVFVQLEWDNEAELRLLLWDHEHKKLIDPENYLYDINTEYSIYNIDRFYFMRQKTIEGYNYLILASNVGVYVAMDEPGVPETNARLTLMTYEDECTYEHRFTVDPLGDYVWLVAYNLNMRNIDSYSFELDNTRLYID